MPSIELRACSPSAPEAQILIAELNTVLSKLYDPADNHFSLDESEVSGANGVFLVASFDAIDVGCGAVRVLDGAGEIKRMYVREAGRGRGVGRGILERLEAEALARGAHRLRLEMGDSQPHAEALYRSAGFSEIPCWGEYLATPASICLGKDLV